MNTVEKLYASVFLIIGVFLVLKNGTQVASVSGTAGTTLDWIIQALQGRQVNTA